MGYEKLHVLIAGRYESVCILELQLQRQNTKASNYRAGEDNHPRNQNQPPQFHYCRDPNITLLLIYPEKARTLTLQAIDARAFYGRAIVPHGPFLSREAASPGVLLKSWTAG